MSEPAAGGEVAVGVDGSEGSRAALDYAMDEAARRGVGVHAITAYAGPDVWSTAEGLVPDARVLHDAAQREATAAVQEVSAVRRERGRPVPEVRTEVAMGPASTVLLHHARGASVLVVGHRGRGGLASRFIGSVGLSAVIHADCTVVVVRD
ncbi:universal stress protein [Actinomycetospora lutea]|uniref:universal stress protein n=1 Tax=Actinomycetospora lutea TaxID=663604 RepID=UPI0023671172|nr:universal stress protein [Actinomycetospora lutea]MDD7937541.1 universal stress protein [Actinomycetospora lutea]